MTTYRTTVPQAYGTYCTTCTDLLHATEHIYIPSALRHQVVSASENKRAKFQKRSTEAGSELVGESKATLVGESKARSMSPAAIRPDTKRAEVCGLPSGRRRCVEEPWRGDALSQPSAMALLTIALLTMALLTMARLTMAILTMGHRPSPARVPHRSCRAGGGSVSTRRADRPPHHRCPRGHRDAPG